MGHARVPKMAADIVYYLDSGIDSAHRGRGMVSVDGEDGTGFLVEDRLDHRQNAGLLFVGSKRNSVGAGRFAADIEDLGPVVEHLECLDEGALRCMLGRVEVAAIGEAVRRDIQDAHDQSVLAKHERSVARVPVEMGAANEGHS